MCGKRKLVIGTFVYAAESDTNESGESWLYAFELNVLLSNLNIFNFLLDVLISCLQLCVEHVIN